MEQLTKKLLGLPELASVHGAQVDRLIVLVHYLMIVLFVGWTAYFLYTLWRFRAGRNPKADYVGVTSHTSSWVELAVAGVEVVLLVGFAVPLWARVVDDFPEDNESLIVRITAQQFAWAGRYTGADRKFGKQDISVVSTSNPLGLHQLDNNLKAADTDGKDDVTLSFGSEIVIPVDTNVIVSVTSLDVIHSFKVLALRVTQDAIPGMRIPIHFKVTKTNTYQINCAQLCGVGHSTMKGILKVVPPAEFDTWIKSKAGTAPANFE